MAKIIMGYERITEMNKIYFSEKDSKLILAYIEANTDEFGNQPSIEDAVAELDIEPEIKKNWDYEYEANLQVGEEE